MLKHLSLAFKQPQRWAAAFARLCVETVFTPSLVQVVAAAASARLCVETSLLQHSQMLLRQLPSRGCVLKHLISKRIEGRLLQLPPRGCVLKHKKIFTLLIFLGSCLRVAVC